MIRAMVWIDNWETFYAEAEKLYLDHPDHVRARAHHLLLAVGVDCSQLSLLRRLQTRYVMKYRHVDGKLELKVTNDRVVRDACNRGLCHSLPFHLTHRTWIHVGAAVFEVPDRPSSGSEAY